MEIKHSDILNFKENIIDCYYDKEKEYSLVVYTCPVCKNLKTMRKSCYKRKKGPECGDCYQKSDRRFEAARKTIEKRPSTLGQSNPNWKGGLVEKTCECGAKFSVYPTRAKTAKYCSRKCKKRYSVSKCFILLYKNIKMRSMWEVCFAQYLDSLNIEWRYEPITAETPYGFYTVDFYVPSWDKYVEVKGFFRDENSRLKYSWFSERYPTILADKDYFRRLGFKVDRQQITESPYKTNPIKEYYDLNIKKEGEGICSLCGAITKFSESRRAYNKTCSRSCERKLANSIRSPEEAFRQSEATRLRNLANWQNPAYREKMLGTLKEMVAKRRKSV